MTMIRYNETQNQPIFCFSFFDAFDTAKRRLRLKFWKHVILDLPERAARQKNLLNEFVCW